MFNTYNNKYFSNYYSFRVFLPLVLELSCNFPLKFGQLIWSITEVSSNVGHTENKWTIQLIFFWHSRKKYNNLWELKIEEFLRRSLVAAINGCCFLTCARKCQCEHNKFWSFRCYIKWVRCTPMNKQSKRNGGFGSV